MSQRRRAQDSNPGSTERQGTGRLVAIDQGPLRRQATADCSQAMARLERVRAGWHHFERKDKPAFIRWRAREFGALLSTARDVEIEICDLQALVHEVELEMRRTFQDPFTAYQRVLARRANPTAVAEAASARSDRGATRKVSDFEKEALFQEWVKHSLGTNPDKMDDAAYAKSFEAFKSHMFRGTSEEPLPNENRPGGNRPVIEDEDEKEDENVAVDTRVKELYRRLVRRLHPDLRADGSAAVSALWHEVQEAYAANDVARMEILLALSEIEAQQTADQSLSQMQAVLTELERAGRALEKSLREAEGEDAWDFARIGPNPELRLRVERQLKSDLASRTKRLALLRNTIAEWAQGPIANRKLRIA